MVPAVGIEPTTAAHEALAFRFRKTWYSIDLKLSPYPRGGVKVLLFSGDNNLKPYG